MAALYHDPSVPLTKVAAAFGVPVSTFLRWIAEMDWPRRSSLGTSPVGIVQADPSAGRVGARALARGRAVPARQDCARARFSQYAGHAEARLAPRAAGVERGRGGAAAQVRRARAGGAPARLAQPFVGAGAEDPRRRDRARQRTPRQEAHEGGTPLVKQAPSPPRRGWVVADKAAGAERPSRRIVIPAKAGIHDRPRARCLSWMAAFAAMTWLER